MEAATQIAQTTHSLEVPGAVLTYDVRENASSTQPTLLMIGSPMGAAGFGTLAGFFTDRTVVTYDPRGVERSEKADPTTESTPDQHADDLHRIIAKLDGRPVDVFASSGGAINAFALVSEHPADVRTLVAHEPPAAQVLPDRCEALAAVVEMHQAYERDGFGHAMAKFIAVVSHQGTIPADFGEQPVDPAMFGLPPEDDGSREDPLFAQNLLTCTHYQPDFDALSKTSARVVIAAGVESEGTLASRAAYGVAERLGTTPHMFPSDHGGFLGGEYGQTGKPEEFARVLRQLLSC